MKQVINFFMFVLFFFCTTSAAVSQENFTQYSDQEPLKVLPAADFLSQANEVNRYNRYYFSKILLTVGGPLMASSLFLKDEGQQYTALGMGAGLMSIGALRWRNHTRGEAIYTGFVNGEYDAITGIKKMNTMFRQNRYLSAASLLLNIILSQQNKSFNTDEKTMISTVYAMGAVSMLIYKTPGEHLTEAVLNHQITKNTIIPSAELTRPLLSFSYIPNQQVKLSIPF